MGQMVYILGLLFIASIISQSTAERHQEKYVQKSRLMFEYNWPEPSKNLNRLPHPHSCHHFVHIKHDGTQVVKRCHGHKVFDYRSLRCQNKPSAKCWMDIVKKGITKKVKQHFSCPFPWGLYPDKEDCTLFYECMGGKVYPRKCPDSTLFDMVERICVHSSKALCAQDSDISTRDKTASHPHRLFKNIKSKKDILSGNINSVSTAIAFEPSRTFGIDSKESSFQDADVKKSIKSENKTTIFKSPYNSGSTMNYKLFRTSDADSEENNLDDVTMKGPIKSKNKYMTSKSPVIETRTINRKSFKTTDADSEENSSEEVTKKGRTKSKNKYITSKSPFISTSTVNRKSFKTTDPDSEENSSEEIREKGRTKSKNKYTTSKSSSIPTSTMNRKSFKTTDADSEENSSEEDTEKGRTKSKNKYITSKSPFIVTSTVNRKLFKTTDADSEEDSSVEKGNEISSKHELKSTISKVRPSSASTYSKEDVISISTDMLSENPQSSTSSSQGGHSTEVPFQVSSIKPLVSTENNLNSTKTTATLVENKKDNTNDDMKKTSLGTEITSEELTSSVEPFSHKRTDSTTKIPFTDSSTFRSEITESSEIGSKSLTTSSILCPDFDSYLPHPKNKNLYIACVGGIPTVMKCPENLVYDSNTTSCIYDKI